MLAKVQPGYVPAHQWRNVEEREKTGKDVNRIIVCLQVVMVGLLSPLGWICNHLL